MITTLEKAEAVRQQVPNTPNIGPTNDNFEEGNNPRGMRRRHAGGSENHIPNIARMLPFEDDEEPPLHTGPVEAEPPSSRASNSLDSTTTYKPDVRESEAGADEKNFWCGVFDRDQLPDTDRWIGGGVIGTPEETEGRAHRGERHADHGANQEIKTIEVMMVRYDWQGCLLEAVIDREMNVPT
eukprot:4383825-Heterocapsa_arctica.AAC.1